MKNKIIAFLMLLTSGLFAQSSGTFKTWNLQVNDSIIFGLSGQTFVANDKKADIQGLVGAHGGWLIQSYPNFSNPFVWVKRGGAFKAGQDSANNIIINPGTIQLLSTTQISLLSPQINIPAGDSVINNGFWRYPRGAVNNYVWTDSTAKGYGHWALAIGDSGIASSADLAWTATKPRVGTVKGGVVKSVVLNTSNVLYSNPVTFTTSSNTATGSLSLVTQSANTHLAGPTSGGAATPTFRALVAADLPTISLTSGVSGVLPAANGGTGINNGSNTLTLAGSLNVNANAKGYAYNHGAGLITYDTIRTVGTDILYASNYGVVADGVTDNTAAFNTFMAACKLGQNKGELPVGTIVFLSKPNNIDFPFVLGGKGLNSTILLRKYNEATDSVGLLNIVAASGIDIHDMAIESAVGNTGGSMIAVRSTSSFASSGIVLENLWLSTFGSNTQAYTVYMNGDTKVTGAVGVRDVSFKNVNIFGATTSSILLKSVVGLVWTGGGVYAAGSTATNAGVIFISGTPAVPSQYISINVVSCFGLNLSNSIYASIVIPTIGNVAGVSITSTSTASYYSVTGSLTGTVDGNWLTSSVNNVGASYLFGNSTTFSTISNTGVQVINGSLALSGSSMSLVNGSITQANASGGFTSATSSNYLTLTGSTANNSNMPGILFKGGSALTSYPYMTMNNSGQGFSWVGGIDASHTQNFNWLFFNNGTSGDANSYANLSFGGTNRFRFQSDGKLGVGGVTAPLAYIGLPAGSATANTAPIQFTDGPRETTARAGIMEFDKNFYFTNSSALRMGDGGIIQDYIADAGTTTSTSETDLYTYTAPANALLTNKDKLIAQYALQLTSTGGVTKQVRAYFGGTLVFDTGALSISASTDFILNITIIKDGSTSVRVLAAANTTGAATNAYAKVTKVTGLTLSATNILKITGTVGTGAVANDINAIAGTISFQPAQ